MPRKDGFETCKEIRAWELEHAYKPIPIVALSAYVMSDMVEKCKESGFTRYLSKPVVFQQLKGKQTFFSFHGRSCGCTNTDSRIDVILELLGEPKLK